jgi:hypothetical protein
MARLPLLYLVAAAACMVCGVCLGVFMGIVHDFQLAPVHAHLNLLGWTSLGLIGLVHRAWPELLEARGAALVQFGLCVTAAALFPFGIYLSITQQAPGLAIGASLAWLAGMLLFLARLVLLALRPARSRMPAMLAAE